MVNDTATVVKRHDTNIDSFSSCRIRKILNNGVMTNHGESS